jgi:hypothetical protein
MPTQEGIEVSAILPYRQMRSTSRPIVAKAKVIPKHQLSLISLPSQTELTRQFSFGGALVDPSRCVFAGSLNAGNLSSAIQLGLQVVCVAHGPESMTAALEADTQNGSKEMVADPQLMSEIASGVMCAFLVEGPVAAAMAVALLRKVLQGQITMEACMEQLTPHIE